MMVKNNIATISITERFEKQQFNKFFDNSRGKVYDKFRDILSEDRDNDQPLYKTRPRQAKHGEIIREEVENFGGRFGKI